MATHMIDDDTTRVMEIKVNGKLTGRDYERVAPEIEHFITQHGKVSMIFDMHDFHGWNAKGMWMDFRFGARHRHDMERLALIGEKPWQDWTSKLLCGLFTDAEIRYFDRSHADDARLWIRRQ